jgi:transcription elongation GreA/GreB family factor
MRSVEGNCVALGKKVGDKVEVEIPRGTLRMEILEIE